MDRKHFILIEYLDDLPGLVGCFGIVASGQNYSRNRYLPINSSLHPEAKLPIKYPALFF
jgi:hypothetical protein